ncbi:MAG: hypothetical protein AAB505_01980, partial [Patescibacteria group bacterium]
VTDGFSNTAVGQGTLPTLTEGDYNVSIGSGSGVNLVTGNSNTFIGTNAGNASTGSNNTFLGYSADVLTASLSNATAIGYNAKVGASNSLVLGGTDSDAVNVGIGTTSPYGLLSVEMSTTNPSFVVSNSGSSTPAFFVSGVNGNGRVGVGTSTLDHNFSVDGNWRGNTTVRNDTFTSDQTITIATSSLIYHLVNNTGTTEANITITYNITGLPDVEGGFAFIYTSPQKGTTSVNRTSTIVVQVNGTQVGSKALLSSTASNGFEAYTLIRASGAWHIVGTPSSADLADLAEWIEYTGARPTPGELVSLSDEAITVQRSQAVYDDRLIGVVSTDPHTVMGPETPTSIPLTLAGRVPVKVSNQNGSIRIGDRLTSSSISGVAMRATRAGRVIGRALESYDDQEIGQILVLVENGDWLGPRLVDALDGIDPNDPALGKLLIEKFVQDEELTAESDHLSEILTDRLVAGLEIISPRVITKGLVVDEIGSLYDAVNLSGDVNFFGRPYFTTDTAGFAIIREGDRRVTVTFDRQYLESPIINVTMSAASEDRQDWSSSGVRYLLTDEGVSGFTIELNRPTPIELKFNWLALAVKQPKIFTSSSEESTPTPPAPPDESPPDSDNEDDQDDSSSETPAPPLTDAEELPAPPDENEEVTEETNDEPPAVTEPEPPTAEPEIEPVIEEPEVKTEAAEVVAETPAEESDEP